MNHAGKRAVKALVVALSILIGMTACTLFPWEQVEESSEETDVEVIPIDELDLEDEKVFINTLPVPSGADWGFELPGLTPLAQEKYKLNDDTIGWLRIPNTSIDDVVMFYPDDENEYYLRRDFDKRRNDYGSYFADFRCTFGEKMRWQDLSFNTCIYGHSMDENRDGKAFSQIKKYLDEDFARENPYLYFSTLEEDMAFEVFAVFYGTIRMPYNVPKWGDFNNMLTEVLDRSIYNYDIKVTESDKILTLSTCCYNIDSSYPNDYRYVVMGKLVQPGQPVRETAQFALNPSPKAPDWK